MIWSQNHKSSVFMFQKVKVIKACGHFNAMLLRLLIGGWHWKPPLVICCPASRDSETYWRESFLPEINILLLIGSSDILSEIFKKSKDRKVYLFPFIIILWFVHHVWTRSFLIRQHQWLVSDVPHLFFPNL